MISKRCRILYDDLGQASSKIGKVISIDDSFIEIQTDHKTEFIPICKIIRTERLDNE